MGRFSMRNIPTSLLVALLAASVLVAGYRHRHRAPLRAVTGRVLEWRVRRATLAGAPNGRGVAFLFRATDCPRSLDVIDSLNALRASGHSAVHGFLIAQTETFADWKSVPRIYGMRFDVEVLAPDAAAVLLARLDHRHTPLRLVLARDAPMRLISEPAY
jgi:hypothetical protein